MTNSEFFRIRIRRKGRLLFAGALFLFVVGVLVLQPGWAPPAMTQEQTVTLDVAVMERDAEAYGSLTMEDLVFYEEGVTQQMIFLTAQNASFSLGILIDGSSSMRAQLTLIQKTVQDVTTQMGSADEAFVAAFTAKSEVIQDFTSSQPN